jgi:hypothetical protein
MNELDRVGDVERIVVDVAVNKAVQIALERVSDRRRMMSGDEFPGQMPTPRRFPGANPFETAWIEANLLLENRGRQRRPSLSPLLLPSPDGVEKSRMTWIESVRQQMQRALAMRHREFDAGQKQYARRVSCFFKLSGVVNDVVVAGNNGRQPATACEVRQLPKRQRAVAGDAVNMCVHQRVVGEFSSRLAQWLNRNSLLLSTPQ